MIVLRMTHFIGSDDFKRVKKEWEEENPGTLVIPCTMEAVNPKRGKWLKSDIPCEEWKCSACGGGAWYYDVKGYVRKSRYCPNCGAYMGDENERFLRKNIGE